MGTYIVVGAYQFVGFHVTQYLLGQGEEVIGIDWEDTKTNRYIIEEKELEIGRNANFTYLPFNKLRLLDVSEPFTILLSFYDSRRGKTALKGLHINDIVSFLEKCKKNGHGNSLKIVVLLPIDADTEGFQTVLNACEGFDSVKTVYLPTIYGPWQPATMGFEAGISQLEQSTIQATLASEYREDALFIADFIEGLEQLLSSTDRCLHLKSSIDDHWNTCAKLIFKQEVIDSLPPQSPIKATKGTVYEVPNKTSPEEGITLQIEQNKRLNLLTKWRMRDKKD
ncbi:hypothetical protein ACQKL0_15900 [Peribacillus sp. NPDC097264]|uniref:hypothetical protein n=1 Tax=Peribacillus sp. NPDC097264 TaxID=3390616 RepID=UPI003CFFB8EC